MRNVLITGSNGQLGSELKQVCKNSIDEHFHFTDVAELDITSMEEISQFCKTAKIDVIINCAAYTQVDKAEDESNIANLINNEACKNLATVCKELGIFLIHISTDYVFSGDTNLPYKETDPTDALGVYGKTKLAGEQSIQRINCEHIIIRTSWLYSSYGGNFVKTIRRLTEEKEQLKVVFDQVGTPTYAADLAEVIRHILATNNYKDNQGIYHFSNEGVCSWYDFAVQIRNLSNHKCEIVPCYSEEFKTKVKRPNYSVLDKTKIKHTFQIKIPYWLDALQKCIEKL